MEGGDVEYCRVDEEDEEEGIVSKTRWGVVNRGLKKVVITGIMVSSAPLVLPPLITICVVGFVVLVPVGVFLGSYACTEKLMSKLLPPLPPPLLLDYHSQPALRDENYQVEEEYAIQAEMKMEGEQRIELVRDNEEGSEYVEKHDDKKGIGVDDEHLEDEVYEEEDIVEYLEGEDDNIDENMEKGAYVGESLEREQSHEEDKNLDEGYEEDSGEYLEAEHKVKNEIINIDDNLEQGYEEEANDKYLEGEHQEDEKDNNGNIDENLALEEGYEEEDEDAGGEYLEGEHLDKNEISIDEDLEQGYEEDIGEYLKDDEENEGPMPEMNLETDDEPGREEEEEEEEEEEVHSEFGENVTRTKGLDLVATSAKNHNNYKVGNDETEENFEHKSVTLLGNVGSSMKEDEEHLEKPSRFEEEEEEEEEDKKDTPSSKVDENPLIGTEAKVEMITVAVVKETEFAQQTEKQGNAAEQVSPPPQHNQINSNQGAGAPSSEVMVSEEKIWEQISAIRGILGYTAAPQSSTVDELKALFILTGVEPPSPFEDPSDLADVDEKLRLLMSIVGAK